MEALTLDTGGLAATEGEERWPPPGALLILSGTVLGEPRPAGSKTSGVVTRKTEDGRRVPVERPGGGWRTFTKESAVGAETWRSDIRDAVLRGWGERAPLDGPLALSLTFYADRPNTHYGTGRNAGCLKPSAPAYPHSGRLPDGTKLTRAFEDALNKLVWRDDRRFVDCRWSRRYGTPRAEYRLYRLLGSGADQLPL
jgi:Holliday junction resolvase RusA-like endonuclease